jgi:ketosteroid isomerase-like protein
MSLENVEVIRRSFEAVDRGDLDAMAAEIGAGFEYVATGTVVGLADTYRGAQGFRRFLEWFWVEFDEPNIEIRSLIAAGDEVVTWVEFRGRGAQSGAETSMDLWHVWTLRAGKVVRGRAFTSRDEALQTAGLSE